MMDDTAYVTDDTIDAGPLYPVGRRSAAADESSIALEAFVAEHYDRLIRLARLICHDATEATDAVQSGLERAWRHRRDLRDADSQKPWLDRIVVREAIAISRRRRDWFERIVGIDHEATDAALPPSPTPDLVIRVVLDGAFARLSPEQRAVVGLHLYAGYSVAETATIVGAPVETVRSRLRLARERLREALGETVR